MAYTKYSLTPANNNAAPPDGAPEGMLPSAVNDTMRDMMAQIRDCGDGIRGGTYTMTAPVITGGSITGVALSGNTLTSPVITGGSINNTPIGASTRNTGAFTTLTSNGATTFTAGTASTSTTTGTAVITGGLGVSGRINAANFDGIVGANTAAAVSSTDLAYTGTLTGGTGIVNLGSGQFYKDASGNVGIGTSSPNVKLQVNNAATVGTGASAMSAINPIIYADNGSTANGSIVIKAHAIGSGNTIGATRFVSSPDGTNYSWSGMAGIADATNASSILAFYTASSNSQATAAGASTERMRIDSSGNLLVGTTSGSGKLTVTGGAGSSSYTFNADNTNATSGDYNTVLGLGANTNNTASYFLLCTQPGVANRFAIYGNGTYATISDVRLKKNIESARDGYIDDLLKLRVVKYNWNTQEDGENKELGLIAQETEQVFAGLVQESQAPQSEIAYKQIKTSVLPFMLLKAIQEQQVLINNLTTRLNALEEK